MNVRKGTSMKTKKWTVDNSWDNSKLYPQLEEAAYLIQQGEAIAFPTETVYGLGADATNNTAVEKIFLAKGRPSDNPLIVHIANVSMLDDIVTDIPMYAKELMNQFWPGPITFVLPRTDKVCERVSAGLQTVGVRIPNHPVALALIEQANVPVAAPSANTSGRPSPTEATHVFEDLSGRIAGIVDGGGCNVGVESTVVDCTGKVPMILRPGGISKEELEEVVGKVEIDSALIHESEAPKSPGMKYKHYAPKGNMVLVDGSISYIQKLIDEAKKEGKKVGVLATDESKDLYDCDVIISAGSRMKLETISQGIYKVLRDFDEQEVEMIFSETFPQAGIGLAIMNRLRKAANHQILFESE